AVLPDREARDRIVAAVGREQEAAIRREDDAGRALECIRCALLAAGRLELARPRATGRDTVDLFDRAVRRPAVVDNGVVELVRLHVEVADGLVAVHGMHRLRRVRRLHPLVVGHDCVSCSLCFDVSPRPYAEPPADLDSRRCAALTRHRYATAGSEETPVGAARRTTSSYRLRASSTSCMCSSAQSASAISSSVAVQPSAVREYSTRTGTSA